MKLYLAGPMRGYPNFNFPMFDVGAKYLRSQGYEVFSPAERDRSVYGSALEQNTNGDEHAAESGVGFNLREALAADMEYISKHAEGIALLPRWEHSKGARAEVALATALGLKQIVLSPSMFLTETEWACWVADAPPLPEAQIIRLLDGKDSATRKTYPIGAGVLDYFPDALLEVARVSYEGNKKHNPGQPLHWARGKSTDHADALMRHYLTRGQVDAENGVLHSAELAWRALALLQEECEARYGLGPPRGATAPNAAVAA